MALKADGSVLTWGGDGTCSPRVGAADLRRDRTAERAHQARVRRHRRHRPHEPGRHADVGSDGLQAAGDCDPGRVLPRQQQPGHPQHPDQRRPGHLGEPRRRHEGRIDRSRPCPGPRTGSTSSPAAPTTRCGRTPTTAPAGAAGPRDPRPGTSPPHRPSPPGVRTASTCSRRAPANDLQHTAYDSTACSGWCSFGWESLGGGLTTAPAAVSWGPDRIDIFVGGGGDYLYQKVFAQRQPGATGTASAAPCTSDPTVSSKASGELDIYARNASNGLSSLHFGAGLRRLEQLAGPRLARLAQRVRPGGELLRHRQQGRLLPRHRQRPLAAPLLDPRGPPSDGWSHHDRVV